MESLDVWFFWYTTKLDRLGREAIDVLPGAALAVLAAEKCSEAEVADYSAFLLMSYRLARLEVVRAFRLHRKVLALSKTAKEKRIALKAYKQAAKTAIAIRSSHSTLLNNIEAKLKAIKDAVEANKYGTAKAVLCLPGSNSFLDIDAYRNALQTASGSDAVVRAVERLGGEAIYDWLLQNVSEREDPAKSTLVFEVDGSGAEDLITIIRSVALAYIECWKASVVNNARDKAISSDAVKKVTSKLLESRMVEQLSTTSSELAVYELVQEVMRRVALEKDAIRNSDSHAEIAEYSGPIPVLLEPAVFTKWVDE